ncbi:MAG: hypothetical protein IJA58_04940, partial [Lachnospiraceae bacterium]|nr:hypothetical protein [Lachnospiraceae bacterium]
MFSMLMRPVAAAIVLCVIILLVGNGVASLLKIKKSVASVYFCGLIFSWAVTQLVAIPMILTRQSFTATYWLIVVLVGASFLYGIYACRKIRFAWPKWSVLDWISVGVMTASVLILLYVNLVTQRTDADDSRFVVNAVDILRTDTMFLTNPATGEPLENWQGELIKDVTAPWAVFIALCAKLTGSHVAVMAHTSLPLVLLLGVISVWWMLSETFFKKER